MSAKWRRSLAWDDRFFPPWAAPAKGVLRAFSSIPLAVTLLSLVALYGVLASVPVGLLLLAPTYAVYALTLLAPAMVLGAVGFLGARLVPQGAARFVASLAFGAAGATAGVWLWTRFAWPVLHHDPATGAGFMLWPRAVESLQSVTFRRLPGVEMSEIEFYSWWPLRVLLLLFVTNMIVATIRRIEFVFPNIGVLSVHSGIVLIALGSTYYAGAKREGDLLLIAGQADERGVPGVGPPSASYFDNTRVVLYVSQFRGWEQRPLGGIPRYNDYNLGLAPGESAWEASGRELPWVGAPARELDLRVIDSPLDMVDRDISFRVVGYASYAEPVQDWLRAESPGSGAPANPVRVVELLSALPREGQPAGEAPVFVYTLLPERPPNRVYDTEAIPLAIEYTVAMPDQRWGDLAASGPVEASHLLVVETPGEPGFRAVFGVEEGSELAIGETGYTIRVERIAPTPPFPIITEGYKDAQSSVAIVRITPPEGEAFDRYVYHRFPELNQDLLAPESAGERPRRRDPDPAIRVVYLDRSKIQVYFDEPAGRGARALVVSPGAGAWAIDPLPEDATLRDIIPKISLRVAHAWPHAVSFERPAPTPERDRDRSAVGTHEHAMVAVEVRAPRAPTDTSPGEWSTVVWLPFSRYLGVDSSGQRTVTLPDGRVIALAFGRRQHPLPGFTLSLVDFEMIAYANRGAPRDYQSTILVQPAGRDFEPFEHVAKLNAPLTAPYRWDPARSLPTNLLGRIGAALRTDQFKFSQAGWDQAGWENSQRLADQGLIPRPTVGFTVLQAGNAPGIHAIALGGVMIVSGIPWAFYIKPLIMRRRRDALKASLGEAPASVGREAPRPAGRVSRRLSRQPRARKE